MQLLAAGLGTPSSFAFAGGTVFEGDFGGPKGPPPLGGVFVLRGGTATRLAGSPPFASGLAWHKGTLYVAADFLAPQGKSAVLVKAELQAWSGLNADKMTFAKQTVIYTAPKGFPGFNGIAFGADGRLYAGVDVGFSGNDHGAPSKKTPYLYDLLSFTAAGKGLRVVATGMRQPWQFAFPHGSSSPFVTDFGQDAGAKNPPDFLLRVREGDAYGFPQCNWTNKKRCKGFAKPFRFFPAHTDVGGVGNHRQAHLPERVRLRGPAAPSADRLAAALGRTGPHARDRFPDRRGSHRAGRQRGLGVLR